MGLKRLRRSAAHIIALSAILCSFSHTAVGQQNSGSVAGQVIGLSGEEVSTAPIEAKSMESGQIFKTVSSVNGSYSFLELPIGMYEISSPVAGFERRPVDVRSGETIRIDIHFVAPGNTLGTVGDNDLASRIAAYNRPAPPTGPMPRTADGKPDFSGYWQFIKLDGDSPAMQPWAAALTKYRVDSLMKDSPSARCLPDGVTGTTYQLIQTPIYLVFLLELSSQSHRLVFLDGRAHPKDLVPTWYGHSIGKWDGDTLVVDRVGFNEGTWIRPEGLPHTDMLHIIERFRRLDLGHLEVEMTFEDAGAYVRQWTRKAAYELQPNHEVDEYVCAENNLDPVNMIGK
ncbi:MAG TPA: carboxypeptidase-like regulatory domain-containing protein [Bryobacteraceae bacterium]